MNQKSPKQNIVIQVPARTGGQSATVRKPKQQKRRSRKGKASKNRRGARIVLPSLRSMLPHADRFQYAATLIDPAGVGGIRIPDMDTTPSFTCRTVQRFTVSSFGFPQAPLLPTYQAGVMVWLSPTRMINDDLVRIFPLVAGTSNEYCKWSSAGGVKLANRTAIKNLANSYRLVSASLTAIPNATMIDVSGRSSRASLPCNAAQGTNFALDTNVAFPDLSQLPIATTNPVSWGSADTVCFAPHSELVYYYQPGPGVSPFPNEERCVGQLVWTFQGTKQTTFDITVVFNWECIPNNDVGGILNVRPSPYNMQAMQDATNLMSTRAMFHAPQKDVQSATQNGPATPDDGESLVWNTLSYVASESGARTITSAVKTVGSYIPAAANVYRWFSSGQPPSASTSGPIPLPWNP